MRVATFWLIVELIGNTCGQLVAEVIAHFSIQALCDKKFVQVIVRFCVSRATG